MLTKLMVLFTAALVPAFADFKLTQTMKFEMNKNMPMPPRAAESLKNMLEPKVTVMELQGQNMRSRLGRFEILYLLDSSMMYLIDVEKRKYTAVSMSEWEGFAARMQNPKNDPAVAEAIGNAGFNWMKMKLEPAGKGDAGEVAGLGAEVDLYEMKFEITGTPPNPMAAKALTSQRMRIAYWTAPMPPSFAEMGAAQHKFMQMFGASASMTKSQGTKPGASPFAMGEPFMKLQDEYTKKGRFMVKMVMEMYMDFAAMGPVPPELEKIGNEPIMIMTTETKSYSDELLDPKSFVVPADFESVKLEDLDMSGLLQGATAPEKKAQEAEPKKQQ